jgi:transmembrane sensor
MPSRSLPGELDRALDRLIAGEMPEEDGGRLRAWAANSPRREAVVALLSAARGKDIPDLSSADEKSEILARIREGNVERFRLEERAARRKGQEAGNMAGSRVGWMSWGNRFLREGTSSGRAMLRKGISGRQPLRMRDGTVKEFAPKTQRMTHAVTLILCLAVALGLYDVADSGRGSSRLEQSYETPAGRRANVVLRHGIRVTLAPGTSLRVVHAPNDDRADVYLSGEALFVVPHRAQIPFVVHTDNATTRVLGTTFAVRQYQGEPRVRVSVADGRVIVERGTVSDGSLASSASAASAWRIVLSTGMIGEMSDSGVTTLPNSVHDDFAWTRGVLVFRKTSVRDVVADLSRSYGVRIEVADSIVANKLVTWSVPTEIQSLAEALDELSLLIDVTVKRTRDKISLSPGHRTRPVLNPTFSPIPLTETQHGK